MVSSFLIFQASEITNSLTPHFRCIHTYIHSYIYTHIHTYIHAQIQYPFIHCHKHRRGDHSVLTLCGYSTAFVFCFLLSWEKKLSMGALDHLCSCITFLFVLLFLGRHHRLVLSTGSPQAFQVPLLGACTTSPSCLSSSSQAIL